jgi:protein phosphatase
MLAETYIDEQVLMAADSDVGTVREQNEDFFYFSQPKQFFVVCDGMGGHRKGALASQIAAETLRDVMLANDTLRNLVVQNNFFDLDRAFDLKTEIPPAAKKLIAAIRLANRRILYAAAHDVNARGMGTTVSAVALQGGNIIIAHVGDTRVYRLRDGRLVCLTRDHSWLNELIEDKEIGEEQIKIFQKKNVLTRALGLAPTVKIDLHIESLRNEDLYLICSDGLYNALSDDFIQSELCRFHGSLQNKISSLIRNAKRVDGSDNITGGLIYISGNEPAAPYSAHKQTILDETPEVTSYLDQAVKTIYQAPTEKKKISRKKTLLKTMIVIIFTVVALLIYRAVTASAEPTGGSPPDNPKQPGFGKRVEARATPIQDNFCIEAE